jgi:hypothetical protein
MVSAVALGLSAVARSSEEEQYHLMPMRMMVIAFVSRNDPFGDPGDRGNVYPKHADRFAFADLECVAVFGRARIRTPSGLYVIDALGDDCLFELRIRGGFDASADVSNGFDTLDLYGAVDGGSAGDRRSVRILNGDTGYLWRAADRCR